MKILSNGQTKLKFLWRRPSGAAVALVFFALYCLGTLWLPPSFNREGYFASMIDKHRALDRARSPKIIFVGGSNLAFGLDSARVRQAFDRDVVNMGVSLNLGLRYQLEEVKDAIGAGDTIVLCPEYDLLARDPYINNYLFEATRVLPRSALWVVREYTSSPEGTVALVQNLAEIMQSKWGTWRAVLLGQLSQDKPHPSFGALINPGEISAISRSHFSPEGDLLGHLYLPSYAANWISKIAPVEPPVIDALRQFAQFAQSRHACVVLIPPPVARSTYDGNHDVIEAQYKTLKSRLPFPVLAQPGRYVFPNKLFFNTQWHLQQIGRAQRTTMLIQDLCAERRLALKSSARQDAI